MEKRNRRIVCGVILLGLLAAGLAGGLFWRNEDSGDNGYLEDFAELSLEGEMMYPSLPAGTAFVEIEEGPVPMAEGPGAVDMGRPDGALEAGAEGTDRSGAEVAEVSAGMTGYAREVFDLVNEERAKAGLPPFTQADLLTEGAQIRAAELVQKFDHTRPDGRAYKTVLADVGASYRSCGENVAFGQRSPSEVVTAWMGSEGHRQNILRDYTSMGVGYYESGGVKYWSQLFLK